MEQLLSNLANDSLVRLTENSKSTKFIKLDSDHCGTGTGVILVRKDTFNEHQWETSCGSNYNNRCIDCLLDNFCDGIWLLKLGEKAREYLISAPIVAAEGNQVATSHTIYRRDPALSCMEAGVSGWQTEGEAFGYFPGNAKRIVYLDETAITVRWGLRPPYSLGGIAYSFSTGDTVDDSGTYRANFALRPAFNLKSSIVVLGNTDSDGCYTVEGVPGSDGGLYVKNNGLWVKAV